MEEIKPISIDILGCCVSRDIFSNCEPIEPLCINKFMAQMNPVSLFKEPLSNVPLEFKKGHNFTNKMVNIDITKKWKQYFEDSLSDYLLVDFFDCRYSILTNNTSSITNSQHLSLVSDEFLSSGLLGDNYANTSCFDIPFESYKSSLNKLFHYLIPIYGNRIIFLKIYNSLLYITRDNNCLKFSNYEYLKKENSFLQRIYDYIDDTFSFDFQLSTPQLCISSQLNKWGLHPVHYVKEYYEVLFEQIKCIGTSYEEATTKQAKALSLSPEFEKINKSYLSHCLPSSFQLKSDEMVGYANIAPLGNATQSSISQWSQGPDEANCALIGKLTPGWDHSFHTKFEPVAWWMVDLQDYYKIRMVKLFNRDLFRERYSAEKLDILFSMDGKKWVDLGLPAATETGDAYILKIPGLLFRFVKVQVRNTALHFKQIGIYI